MTTSALVGTALALLATLPLAWKWELGVRRVAVGVLVFAALSVLIIALLDRSVGIGSVLASALVWLLTLLAALAVLTYRFYRDPERTPPNRDDAIVSPADGEIVYVREARGGTLPASTKRGRPYRLDELTRTAFRSEDAVVIGIGMSFLDVHVNRAPIGGLVILRRHFSGRFGSLKRPEMVFANERATTVITRADIEVAVVQIASRLVRRIASFVREGERVTLGQRIGAIRLGSQVDVVLPARDVRVTVRQGERVRAGETIVAELRAAVKDRGE